MNANLGTEDKLREALKEVIDPEVGLNVVDLGLIYTIKEKDGDVLVEMTMTTPSCPMTEYLRDQVSDTIWHTYPDVKSVDVQLVWDPPWHAGMISEDSRGVLGW